MADEINTAVPEIIVPDINVPNIDIPDIVVPEFDLSQRKQKQVDPNATSSALGRGVDTMQQGLYGITELIGDKAGWEGVKKWGEEGRISNAEEIAEYGAPIRFKDAQSAKDYISWTVNSGVSMLAEMVPTIAGAAAGTLVAPGPGTLAGLVGGSAVTNLGATAVRQKEIGGEDAEFGLEEMAIAGALTAVDSVGLGLITKPVFKATMKEMVKEYGVKEATEVVAEGLVRGGVTESVATQIAKGAVIGASEGAITTAVSEYGLHAAEGKQADDQAVWDMMIESAVLGGGFGGTVGGISQHVANKQRSYQYDRVDLDGMVNEGQPANTKAEGLVSNAMAFGRDAWNIYTGKATDSLSPKLTQVEPGQIIRNSFDAVENAHRKRRADYTSALNEVEEVARKEHGRKWREKVIEDYQGSKISQSARMLDSWFTRIADDAIGMKLLGEDQRIKDYMPANMDKDKILGNWEQFKKEVREEAQLNNALRDKPQDANAVAMKVEQQLAGYKESLESGNWNKMTDKFRRLDSEGELSKADQHLKDLTEGEVEKRGKMGQERVTSQVGNLELSRLFDADQAFYNRWSKGGNLGEAGWHGIEKYGLSAAHRMAGVEQWGKNGEKLNLNILQAQRELSKKGTSLNLSDIKRIYDIVDAYDGTYERIQSSGWRGVHMAGQLAVTTATLPLVLLSSLPEGFNIAMKTDMSTFIRANIATFASYGTDIVRKMLLRGPSERHLTNATQMSMAGQTLAQADIAINARLTDPGMSDRVALFHKRFFRMNGLSYWTQHIRNVSAEAARLQINEDLATIKTFRNSGAGDRANARLVELGITPDKQKILDQTATTPLQRQEKNQIIGDAINRFNRTTALEPSFVDRPLWMSNQKMWMLAQLQGFPTMFTNTVLPMFWNNKFKGKVPFHVIDGLFIISALTMVGAMQAQMKSVLAGREPEEDMLELGMTSIMRNLGPKPVQAAAQAWTATQYGISPVEGFVGAAPGLAADQMQAAQQLVSGKLDAPEYMLEIFKLSLGRSFKSYME